MYCSYMITTEAFIHGYNGVFGNCGEQRIMKCQLCDGKGEYMHQCGGYRPCEHCNGTGKVDITNEEWLNSLSTAEKAKFLANNSEFLYKCGERQSKPKIMYEEDWEYWLKEKHE